MTILEFFFASLNLTFFCLFSLPFLLFPTRMVSVHCCSETQTRMDYHLCCLYLLGLTRCWSAGTREIFCGSVENRISAIACSAAFSLFVAGASASECTCHYNLALFSYFKSRSAHFHCSLPRALPVSSCWLRYFSFFRFSVFSIFPLLSELKTGLADD